MIELSKAVDIIPNVLVRRMENMGTVLMDVDAFNLFGINVPGNVVPLFKDKDGKTCFGCFLRKHGAKQATADDQIIVMLSHAFSSSPLMRMTIVKSVLQ